MVMQRPLEYSKNIRLRFSKGDFLVKIFNATGQNVEVQIPDGRKEFEMPIDFHPYLKEIMDLQISFKSDNRGETHLEYELY